MKIDVHTHILPSPESLKVLRKYGYEELIVLDQLPDCCANMVSCGGKFFRRVESNLWDPQTRLKECEGHGVDIQVLSTVPVMFNYWFTDKGHAREIAAYLNDDIAKSVAQNPGRFIGLGTLPMQDTDLAIKELRRCVSDLKFPGVQIATNICGKDLDHESLFPIFEAAQDLGACIFVHPWYMRGDTQAMKDYWGTWLLDMPNETAIAISKMIFGRVFERLPNLRVLFAHGGGSTVALLGRLAHGQLCRPDLFTNATQHSPYDFLGKFWIDSLAHDLDLLRLLVKKFGREKVALGSDYPFPLGELTNGHYPGKLIEEGGFDSETKEWLFNRAAIEWLGRAELKAN